MPMARYFIVSLTAEMRVGPCNTYEEALAEASAILRSGDGQVRKVEIVQTQP